MHEISNINSHMHGLLDTRKKNFGRNALKRPAERLDLSVASQSLVRLALA